MANQITTVVFPAATAFGRTGFARVPTQAAMANTWQAFPDTLCVGPFDEDDPFTESVRTQFFTPVPKDYIPLVMGQPHWTPRQLWVALGGQIATDRPNIPCAPLLKWLGLASTLTTGASGNTLTTGASGNAASGPPVVSVDPLEVPLANEWLNRRVWSWVLSDLPALAHRIGGTASVMTDSFVAMTMEFAKQREDAAAAQIAAKAPIRKVSGGDRRSLSHLRGDHGHRASTFLGRLCLLQQERRSLCPPASFGPSGQPVRISGSGAHCLPGLVRKDQQICFPFWEW
jgi:hypothetical protein